MYFGQFLKNCPKEVITYNFPAYELHPKGLYNILEPSDVNMCNKCTNMLVKCGRQPKDSLANWHYTGYDELPGPVREAFESASVFDLMLVSHSRAARITQLYSNKKDAPNFGQDPTESQI